MAWTKFQGFVGGSYPLGAKKFDAQRSINLFPEIIESGSGKDAQVSYLKSIPGYEEIMTVGDGPIRMILPDNPEISTQNPTNRFFVASGDEMYVCEWDDVSAWTSRLLGSLDTSTGPVSGAVTNIDLGVAVFVDGTSCYYYQRVFDDMNPDPGESFVEFSDVGYPPVPDAIQVLWIDGYFIYIQANTGNFFISGVNQILVDPLSFSNSEGSIDNIVAGISITRDLILFNENSTEVFSNTGNADFPFERVSGGFIEVGCKAALSVAKIDSTAFWLARDEFGQGMIYSIQGLSPRRISTHALEEKINTYTNLEDATAYTYQFDGHKFYVINFTEATWAYDLTTGIWSERASFTSGEYSRHLLDILKFYPYRSIHIASDATTNKIYQINNLTYDNDGAVLLRERTSPHVSAIGNRMFCNALRIDMQVGVGLNGSAQGSDPMVMLSWSDDGGNTWSNERTGSIGKIGEYERRVIFRKLGSYRQRTYKLRFSDPVDIKILSADIDIEVGGE